MFRAMPLATHWVGTEATEFSVLVSCGVTPDTGVMPLAKFSWALRPVRLRRLLSG